MAFEKTTYEPNTAVIMDEFALFKGHRYATVVIDADTQQALWMGEGCSRAAMRPFFKWLGPEAYARIEVVAMDTALDLEALLAANRPLMKVYLLKELWYALPEQEARQRWEEWIDLASEDQGGVSQ